MEKQMKIMAVLVMVGVFSCSSLLYAQVPENLTEDEIEFIQKKREMKQRFKAKMKEELGLTDEQQEQLEQHKKSHRSQAKQYRESMKELKEKLHAELEKADFDENVVRDLHDQMKTIKTKMADHRLEGILGARKILSDEQFKKFHEMKKHKKGKWGHRKGGFGGYGEGSWGRK